MGVDTYRLEAQAEMAALSSYSTTHCQYVKATAKCISEGIAGTVALHTALAFVKGMSEEVVTGFTKRRFKDFKS